MTLSVEDFMDIENRNNKRLALREKTSTGRWTYDSFGWLDVESRPYTERTCILLRRHSWFEKLWAKYGFAILDEGSYEGNQKHVRQPAFDALYIESTLNDPIEKDISKLLDEVRRLRKDIPDSEPTPLKKKIKRPKKGRGLPKGSRKGDRPIYDSEWEFREWLEDNLDQFGFKRIILSQEVCPDYVFETESGDTLCAEAELFASNFIAHGHDPKKVDLIVACFSAEDQVAGVPVRAAINLKEYDPPQLRESEIQETLTQDERRILRIVFSNGSIELSALAKFGFSGRYMLFRRVSPEIVGKMKYKRIDDSIFQAVGAETRSYITKFHHILLGANLSDRFCKAMENLSSKGLVALRPIPLISALYDGVMINHKGWVPTEVYATEKAYSKFKLDSRERLIRNLS